MKNWTADDIPSQSGRSFLITGPGGLGFETGLALARRGGRIILAGRDPAKGRAACEGIRARVTGASVDLEILDLASLASIRQLAYRLKSKLGSLDVLINNAGVMAPPERRLTADGFEIQFGTNHLGHFALTGLLLPLLRGGRQPRVVTVSSIAHRNARIDFDDLQSSRKYSQWASYGQSKLANLMFALELQRRSDSSGWGLLSLAAHPGTSSTELMVNGPGSKGLFNKIMLRLGPHIFQPAWQGALPTLRAATAPDVAPGAYYGPDGFLQMRGWPVPTQPAPQAQNLAAAQRLWEESQALTGSSFQ